MPKVKKDKGGGEKSGGAMTLAEQILQGDTIRARGRQKSRDTREENEDRYVDERLSRKILQQARIQQEELQTEYGVAPEKKKAPATSLGKTSAEVIVHVNDSQLTESLVSRSLCSTTLNMILMYTFLHVWL